MIVNLGACIGNSMNIKVCSHSHYNCKLNYLYYSHTNSPDDLFSSTVYQDCPDNIDYYIWCSESLIVPSFSRIRYSSSMFYHDSFTNSSYAITKIFTNNIQYSDFTDCQAFYKITKLENFL